MQRKFIARTPGCRRLVILFADWAMDWRPFRSLRVDGYDLAVVWDYRDLTFSWRPFMAYHEVCLVAWGMGVFAASLTVHELLGRITKRIAVNGTLDPVSDLHGMPRAAFHGTLNALSPSTLRKHYLRMCGQPEQFDAFLANRPQRTVSDVADELRQLETHTIFHVPQMAQWDLAVVSRTNTVIPTQNQVRAWHQTAPIQFIDDAHFPDFATLLPRLLINKDRLASRLSPLASVGTRHVASASVSQAATDLHHHIAAALMRRFKLNAPRTAMMSRIIEAGCGTGTLTALYLPEVYPTTHITLWDIAPSVGTRHVASAPANQTVSVTCDAEVAIRRVPTGTVGVIFAASLIHWLNSPATFMRECARALAHGGYLVLSTFVRGTLDPLTQLGADTLNLPTAEGWRRILPADALELLVCEAETIPLAFPSPRHVLEHLRATGANAATSPHTNIAATRRILNQYPRDTHGNCPLTYRPLYIIMRKPQN